MNNGALPWYAVDDLVKEGQRPFTNAEIYWYWHNDVPGYFAAAKKWLAGESVKATIKEKRGKSRRKKEILQQQTLREKDTLWEVFIPMDGRRSGK